MPTNRYEALAKLKKLKSDGTKHKYEVKPMQNVYEEVSEQEYTDRVVQRQHDNWIVDDCKGYNRFKIYFKNYSLNVTIFC